jgi:hypothetical protein
VGSGCKERYEEGFRRVVLYIFFAEGRVFKIKSNTGLRVSAKLSFILCLHLLSL